MNNNQINEKDVKETIINEENVDSDTNANANEKKKYNLKNDVIFKAFFAKKGNEQFLIDFLTGILKIEIKGITIREEVDLLRLSNEEKGGRLDLQATLNDGTIVNIEMQMRNRGDIEDRTAFYGANVLSRATEKGTSYQNIKQVIMINILNYNLLEYKEYLSDTVTVLNKHREREVIDLIKYYFIELPKFRKQNPDMDDKMNQWLAVIDDMDRGKIKMAEEKNETIKSALDEIGKLTGDEEIKRMAELRDKWERDRISEIQYAKNEGIKEGIRETKIKTAKKMLEEGIEIEKVIKITGLTKEEVLELKKLS